MNSTSGNIFKSGSANYEFFSTIYSYDMRDEQTKKEYFTLDNECILSFEYTNELNKLCLVGNLVYRDKVDEVGRFLNYQYVYLAVSMHQMEEQRDGNIVAYKRIPESAIELEFLVDGIEIVDRQGNEIFYKIKLISSNWLKCSSYINYSNYNKQEESILDITKNILVGSELKVKVGDFDQYKTNVKLNYTTHMNDNVFSTISFVWNKLYYYSDMDASMKFLVYDEHTNEYGLLDLGNDKMSTKDTTSIIMSMFNTSTEKDMFPQGIQMATVTKFPKRNMIANTYNYNIYSYDISTNKFGVNNFKSNDIITPQRTSDSGTVQNKFNLFNKNNFASPNLSYEHSGSYWNNNVNIYNNWVQSYIDESSLVVNIDGNIKLYPSCKLFITIDRNVPNMDKLTESEVERIKHGFKYLEGGWYIAKTRYIISPSASTFKQNLVVFRNLV